MHPILFKIGPLEVRFYGLMYVVAILVGLYLIKKEVKRKGIALSSDDVTNFVLWVVLGGIVGARIYYVIFNWGFYGRYPLEIPAVWHGGLAIHGGLIGGISVAYIYLKKKGIPFLKMADTVAPSIILGQAFGRFGNFMNGDAHGVPTTLPWGITFPPESLAGMDTIEKYGRNLPLHPTMLYEMFINLSIFFFLWFFLRKRSSKDGFLFTLYLVLYSTGRFFIEAFRADSLMLGPLRVAQVVSIILVVGGLIYIWKGRLWEG